MHTESLHAVLWVWSDLSFGFGYLLCKLYEQSVTDSLAEIVSSTGGHRLSKMSKNLLRIYDSEDGD